MSCHLGGKFLRRRTVSAEIDATTPRGAYALELADEDVAVEDFLHYGTPTATKLCYVTAVRVDVVRASMTPSCWFSATGGLMP